MVNYMDKINEQDKYKIIYIYSVLIILMGFFMSPFQEIIEGILKIVTSPSLLITDYFKLGGIGAAFINSGILMLASVYIGQISKTKMSGPLIAAIFTVGGFSLFGKNIYNVISIIFGTYLYSVIKKEEFSKHIVAALFATSLGPIVSQLSFGMNLSPLLGFILGNIGGIIIGLMVPPLAASFVRFHHGFNLYNIGFTAGIVGMVFMSIFRSLGYSHEVVSIIYEETNIFVLIFLMLYFISMISFGIISSKDNIKEYKSLLDYKIKGATDFVELKGFSLTLMNLGILGIISTLIVLICKAPINGPVIGGIFTVVGFGAFGQHPKNILPVMMGVIIGYLLIGTSLGTTGSMLTVLFSPTLASITGYYGYIPGFVAGLLHMSLASNTGYLHGWMNLYNNGFTGGFVAAILVPLFNAYIKKEID